MQSFLSDEGQFGHGASSYLLLLMGPGGSPLHVFSEKSVSTGL